MQLKMEISNIRTQLKAKEKEIKELKKSAKVALINDFKVPEPFSD